MALSGNMTIEELALFYFQKEIIAPYHTSQQRRFGHKNLLPTKLYFRLLFSKVYQQVQKA
jgi:hypothetical protein